MSLPIVRHTDNRSFEPPAFAGEPTDPRANAEEPERGPLLRPPLLRLDADHRGNVRYFMYAYAYAYYAFQRSIHQISICNKTNIMHGDGGYSGDISGPTVLAMDISSPYNFLKKL